MVVYLYNINKRPNSTKIPLPSDGVSFQCQIKEETSFMNPVLIFSKDNLSSGVFSPALYNYAQIIYWERFYYITDWVYLNGVWEAHLTVDVLGSFKTQIGNTTAYVVRSASASNGDIIDCFYPADTVMAVTKIAMNSGIYHTTIPSGCFVVGVINADTNVDKMGAITYYSLTFEQLRNMMVYLFSGNIYSSSNITEMGEGLYKSLFNPFQYIVSCMWFPFPASAIGTTTANIKVGYWDTGVSGLLAREIVKETGYYSTVKIPDHPQISRGKYLNHAPFTKLTLYFPPFGEIPIDTMFMQYTNNYMNSRIYIDFITGLADAYFSITNGTDMDTTADPYKYITMRTAQVGVPIQLSQITTDYANTISNAGGAIGSLLTGNIAGLFGNIVSAVESAMPKVSTSGANGCLIEILEPPLLIVEHMQVVNDDPVEFGKPLCANRQLNTLSGYIQCGESDHSFGGTKAENDEINQYLKNGFFYE